MINTTVTLNPSVTVGTNASLAAPNGSIGIGTAVLASVTDQAATHLYGLAGGGGAHSNATVNNTQFVVIGSGSNLSAANNIYLEAGTASLAALQTLITVNALATSKCDGVVTIPAGSAIATINTTSYVTVASGANVIADQDVFLNSSLSNKKNLIAYGHYDLTYKFLGIGFLSHHDDGGSGISNPSSTMTLNGNIVAGASNKLNISIADSSSGVNLTVNNQSITPTTNSGTAGTPTLITQNSSATSPFNSFYAAYNSSLLPTSLTTSLDAAALSIVTPTISSTGVPAIQLTNLSATGGGVVVNSATVTGKGTISAFIPTISITNTSAYYLILDGINVPTDVIMGQVDFQGGASSKQAQLTLNTNTGVASVSITLNAAGPVGTPGNGTSGPAVFVTGAINNTSGSVSITNDYGSLVQTAPINSQSYTAYTPNGPYVVSTSGYYGVGGNIADSWQAQSVSNSSWTSPTNVSSTSSLSVPVLGSFFYPGQTSTGFNANLAVTTAINSWFNPNSTAQSATTFSKLVEGTSTNTANTQGTSWIFFGDPNPYAGGVINDDTTTDATSLTNSGSNNAFTGSNLYYTIGSGSGGGGNLPLILPNLPIRANGSSNSVSIPSPSGITASTIIINSTIIDLNSTITAGTLGNLTLTLGSSLSSALTTFQSQYNSGAQTNPIYTIPSSYLTTSVTGTSGELGSSGTTSPWLISPSVTATYSALTQQITVDQISLGTSTVNVSLTGQIMSSLAGSSIVMQGGAGISNIQNNTGIPVILNGITTGSAQVKGSVVINDYFSNQQTQYVYQPGQAIQVYTGRINANLLAPGIASNVTSLTGTTATYQPVSGLRFNWTDTATLTRPAVVTPLPSSSNPPNWSFGNSNSPYTTTATSLSVPANSLSLPYFQENVSAYLNGSTTNPQLGGDGSNFGYDGTYGTSTSTVNAPGVPQINNSVAFAIDLYTESQTRFSSSGMGNSSVSPWTSTAPVNLGSGNPINVTLYYSPIFQNVTQTLTDTVTNSTYTTIISNVNLASQLRNTTAIMGFTGGTGGLSSTQQISNFSFNSDSTISPLNFNSSDITTNSNGAFTPTFSNDVLTITKSGINNTANAVWFNNPAPINEPFTVSYTYQASGSGTLADGIAFVMQNASQSIPTTYSYSTTNNFGMGTNTTQNYIYPNNITMNVMSSIRADYPVSVSFANMSNGSLSISSDTGITFAGPVLLSCPLTVTANGTIEQTAGTITASQLNLTSTAGSLGSADQPLAVNTTNQGTVTAAGSAGVYLASTGNLNVNSISTQGESNLQSISGFGVSGSGWTTAATKGTLAPSVTANTLTLTQTGSSNAADAIWFNTPVSTATPFTVSYRYNGSVGGGNGAAFVIQGAGTTALGSNGAGLGYAGITPSVAYEMNLINNGGFAVIKNGAANSTFTSTLPVSFASGDPINVTLTYNPYQQTLTQTLSDTVTGLTFSSVNSGVNLAQIGANAYLGFTASTGSTASTSPQTISNFLFQQIQAISFGGSGTGWGTVTAPTPTQISGFGGSGAGWTAGVNTQSGNKQVNPSVTNNTLTLTQSGSNPSASALWYNTPIPTNQPFSVNYTYNGTASGADGVAFVIQNSASGTSAIGGTGYNQGYSGISNSLAFGMEIYQNQGCMVGQNGTFGSYASTSPVTLSSGHSIDVTLSYSPATQILTQTLVDTVTNQTFTRQTTGINLASIANGTTAYLGFTGATGGISATQTVSNFSATFGNVPAIQNNQLPLTVSYTGNSANAAWYLAPLSVVTPFQVDFTYRGQANGADGVAFVMQNDPNGTSAIGSVGSGLGYAGIQNSLALELNIDKKSGTNLAANGATGTYNSTGAVNLQSGHPIAVSLTYNPVQQTMAQQLTDTITGATFSTVYSNVNISQTVGASTAWFGFTGADGAISSNQTISNFSLLELGGTSQIQLTAGGSILAASSSSTITGNQVTLIAGDGTEQGSIGSPQAPISLIVNPITLPGGATSIGIVNVSAPGNIWLTVPTGNLPVGLIDSDFGNVTLNVSNGSILTANNQTALNIPQNTLSYAQLQAMETAVQTVEQNSVKNTINSFEATMDQYYSQYWQLMNNGAVNSSVYTVNPSSIPVFTPITLLALGLPAGTAVTSAQVAAVTAAMYQQCVSAFSNPLVFGTTWQTQSQFVTYDPSYTFTPTNTQIAQLSYNAYSATQAVATLELEPLTSPNTTSIVPPAVPNIIAQNVLLNATGSIGLVAQPTVITVQDIQGGSLTRTQQSNLAMATASGGPLQMVGINASGQQVTYTYPNTPSGVTPIGIRTNLDVPVYVNVAQDGALSAIAPTAIALTQTTGNLVVAAAVSSGPVNITAPGSLNTNNVFNPNNTGSQTIIGFGNSGTGWTTSGSNNSSTTISNNVLTFAPSANNSTPNMASYNTPVSVTQPLQISFTYTAPSGTSSVNSTTTNPQGIGFVIQNSANGALSSGAAGFGPSNQNATGSAAFVLQQYPNSGWLLTQNGTPGALTGTGGVNLTSGDPIQVLFSYDPTNLTLTIHLTDSWTGATYQQTMTNVNLENIISGTTGGTTGSTTGSTTATIGFVGNSQQTQQISNFVCQTFSTPVTSVTGFGTAGSGWTIAGNSNASPTITNNVLTLTSGTKNTANAAWYNAPIPVTQPLVVSYNYTVPSGSIPVNSITGFGSNGTGWKAAGNGPSTMVTNNVLTLTTTGIGNTADALWYQTPVSVTNGFQASFTYTVPNSGADGVAFVLQNSSSGVNAVGGIGSGVGYSGIQNSFAFVLDQYTQSQLAFGQNGSIGSWTNTAPVSLLAGDPINVQVTYNPTNQTVFINLSDLRTGASFSQTKTGVNLATLIGSSSAILGFTGGDGGLTSTQQISNFSFNSLAQTTVSGFGSNGTGWTVADNTIYTPVIANNVLTLTSAGTESSAAALWSNTPVSVSDGLQISYTYQSTGSGTLADGVAFVLQNSASGVKAVGTAGSNEGYSGINNSVAFVLDQYTESQWAIGQAGTIGPRQSTAPVNLSSGNPINVVLSYNSINQTLIINLTDTKTNATYSHITEGVNLAGLIGSGTATMGFTGGTGAFTSTQQISNFSLTQTNTLNNAAGVAFVMQSRSAVANGLGATNWGTDYSGVDRNVAFVLDLISPTGSLNQLALEQNGAVGSYTNVSPVQLASGHTINVTLTYNPVTQTLIETLKDTTTGASYSQTTNGFNLASLIGSSSAIVGFTGGNNAIAPQQQISNFSVQISPAVHAASGFGGSGIGWTTQSAGAFSPAISNNVLTLTKSGIQSTASAAWLNTPVAVSAPFTASFTYKMSATSGTLAGGVAFVLQNTPSGTSALGSARDGDGYTGITNSGAFVLDLYPQSEWAIGKNGVIGSWTPTPSTVNLTSGHPINVTLAYNPVNQTLTETLTDTVTGQQYTNVSTGINFAQLVGASTAYLGFTGGDGGYTSTQQISNFSFSTGGLIGSSMNLVAGGSLGENQSSPLNIQASGTVDLYSTSDIWLKQSTGNLNLGQVTASGSVNLTAAGAITESSQNGQGSISGFGGTGSGWVTNGNAVPTNSANYGADTLTLVNGANQTSSAWYPTSVVVANSFTMGFVYTSSGTGTGMTFTLQNDSRGTSALGGPGSSLGYGGTNSPIQPIQKSLAFQINLGANSSVQTGIAMGYNGGMANLQSQAGVATNPANPTDPIQVLLTFSVTTNTMAYVLVDTVTQATLATGTVANCDLAKYLGNGTQGCATAYMGFTGSSSSQSTGSLSVSNFFFAYGAPAISAASLMLQAGTTIGTSTSPLTMNTQSAGAVNLNATGNIYLVEMDGNLNLGNITTSGTLTASAPLGEITGTSTNSSSSTAAAAPAPAASPMMRSMSFAMPEPAAGPVAPAPAPTPTPAPALTTSPIQVGALKLYARDGIGSLSQPLNIQAKELQATSIDGDITASNRGPLAITSSRDLQGLSAGGSIRVTSTGQITVSSPVKAGSDVTLTVPDQGQSAQNLIVTGTGIVASKTGSIRLTAADNVQLLAGSLLHTLGADGNAQVSVQVNRVRPGATSTSIQALGQIISNHTDLMGSGLPNQVTLSTASLTGVSQIPMLQVWSSSAADQFTLDQHLATAGEVYQVSDQSIKTDKAIVGLNGIKTVSMNLGSGNDTVNISSTVGLNSLTMKGNQGNDQFNVAFDPQSLTQFVLDGGAGTNGLKTDAPSQPVWANTGTLQTQTSRIAYSQIQTINTNTATSVNGNPLSSAIPSALLKGLNPTQQYVQTVYWQLLGRIATTKELSPWVSQLTRFPNTRTRFAQSLVDSTEYRSIQIRTWYQTYLGRPASTPEVNQSLAIWKKTYSNIQALAPILATQEFYNITQSLITTGTPQQRYVAGLYKLVMSPSITIPTPLKNFMLLTPVRQGRSAIVLRMLTSPEYMNTQRESLSVTLNNLSAANDPVMKTTPMIFNFSVVKAWLLGKKKVSN